MKNIFLFAIFFSTFYHVNAQYIKLFDFSGVTTGNRPRNNDLLSDGTFLYGTTPLGGISDNGTIFKIKSDGTGYSKLLDFNSANGGAPRGTLISEGNFLYGVTMAGGTVDGTIFKIKTDGTGFITLHNFGGISPGLDGSQPFGSLVSDGIFLYGVTEWGGSYGNGTIFKIKSDGTGYSNLFNFGDTNGNQANGSLIYDGTFLYGMTLGGGTMDGTIFKINPDGTGYSILFNFGGTNGYEPNGTLISDGTFLYGMTHFGGTSTFCYSGCGAIFKIKLDGTGYSKLLDFNGANGGNPEGSLISDGTFLYGMTSIGGFNGDGVVFKIKLDGTSYTDLFDFSGANGQNPCGSLISDGTFLYGMTQFGGTGNCVYESCGVIFKYQFDQIATKVGEFAEPLSVSVVPNPSFGIFTVNLKNKTEGTKICVYDMLGKCVYDKVFMKNSNKEIDLNSQPKGVYFMEILCPNERVIKKIVLQ